MNKTELINQTFVLDLGSNSVEVIVKEITEDKVIVEYLYSTPGRTEEFSISDFEHLAMVKIKKLIKNITPPSPPKDRSIKESSWLETLTFGLYKTKNYLKRNNE